MQEWDTPDKCRFKNEICHQCWKVGHIKQACRSKPRVGKQISEQETTEEHTETPNEEYNLYAIKTPAAKKSLMVPVTNEKQSLEMELDTGTDMSLISEETYLRLSKHVPLQESRTSLRSYSGSVIGVKGRMDVNVSYYGDQHKRLPLLVMSGKGPSLLGKEVKWNQTKMEGNFRVQEDTLEQVLQEHGEIFQDELGMLKGFQAKIYMDSSAQLKFCKAHLVPYAIQMHACMHAC